MSEKNVPTAEDKRITENINSVLSSFSSDIDIFYRALAKNCLKVK